MGQTQSQQTTNADLYAQYINQQQELIRRQQEQINSLYKYNMSMNSNSNTPINIILQKQQHEKDKNEQMKALPSGKLDPYKILGLPKNFDEKMLKKAYLKAAMVSHPDRGGTEDKFQQVSIAYALLQKKLKSTSEVQLDHNELKKKAEQDISLQNSQQLRNVNMREDFDINVFNKIYQENKIKDVYDSGYGDWMSNNPVQDKKQTRMFQSGFNKDMFNSEFENYKRENRKKSNSVVEYKEPEERMSMTNQDSLMLLGRGKISDFSGEANSIQYTDYKKAFTDGSTLIDVNSVSVDGRASSMKSIEQQRSNISYTLSEADARRVRERELLQEREENKRVQRLNMYDRQHSEAYEKIHSLLLK